MGKGKRRFISKSAGIAAFVFLGVLAAALLAGLLADSSSKTNDEAELKLKNAQAVLVQAGTQLAQMQEDLVLERAGRLAEQKANADLESRVAAAEATAVTLAAAVRWQEVMFYAFPSTQLLFEMQTGLAQLLSEANGAPNTPDDSSPWERLQGFMALMDTGEYSEAYEFLSPAFHEKCGREQFALAAKRKYRPAALRFGAYVDTQIVEDAEGGVAFVGLTFGLTKKDVAVVLSRYAESGSSWFVDWMPQFCD